MSYRHNFLVFCFVFNSQIVCIELGRDSAVMVPHFVLHELLSSIFGPFIPKH